MRLRGGRLYESSHTHNSYVESSSSANMPAISKAFQNESSNSLLKRKENDVHFNVNSFRSLVSESFINENKTMYEELQNTQTADQVLKENHVWHMEHYKPDENEIKPLQDNVKKYNSSYLSMVTSTPCAEKDDSYSSLSTISQLQRNSQDHHFSKTSFVSRTYSSMDDSIDMFQEKIMNKEDNRFYNYYNTSNKKLEGVEKTIKTKNDEAFQNKSDSLETYLFHDISFSKTAEYYSRIPSDKKDDTSDIFYKLDGTFLSEVDITEDEEENLNLYKSTNHVQRSIYRQKRRDWYLRRHEYDHKLFSIVYFYIFLIQKFFKRCMAPVKILIIRKICRISWVMLSHIFLLISSLVSTIYKLTVKKIIHKTWKILNSFISLLKFTKQKRERLLAYRISNGNQELLRKEEDDGDVLAGCCYGFCVWVAFTAVLVPLIFTLVGLVSIEEGVDVSVLIPDPTLYGLHDGVPVIIETEGEAIPLWHIYPSNVDTLTQINKGPVILHLRKDGVVSSLKRIAVYQSLLSLGYHVIAPINLLNSNERHVVWSWIKRTMNDSALYLWGDHMETEQLTSYAKTFCNNLIPPSGVIIEVSNKYPVLQHRSLEVWSCNCTTVLLKPDSSYHKYNHVKCPFNFQADATGESQEDVYNHIVSCIQALHK